MIFAIDFLGVETMQQPYSTGEFEEKYTYCGNDLGHRYTKEKTTFRLWAPTAQRAAVRLYKSGTAEARDLLNRNGYDEKGLGTFEKVRTYLMVNLQTMTDASTSHIAKMLIQGSTMGVTSLTRQIRDYDGEDTEVLDFAKKQLKREEKNIDELKKFL